MHYGNSILTSVYQKPTHTLHLPSVHKAVANGKKTLLSRANALSSSYTLLQKEHSMIAHALDANNYPQTFVSTHSHPRRSDTPWMTERSNTLLSSLTLEDSQRLLYVCSLIL